jgi:hypothetical protein
MFVTAAQVASSWTNDALAHVPINDAPGAHHQGSSGLGSEPEAKRTRAGPGVRTIARIAAATDN